MKNFEKYKTPEERGIAFNKFCSSHRLCSDCACLENSDTCKFKWLELEYEEKPLPCPFCGDAHIEIYDEYSKVYRSYRFMCKNCEAEIVINAQSKEEAIKKWNRRAEK